MELRTYTQLEERVESSVKMKTILTHGFSSLKLLPSFIIKITRNCISSDYKIQGRDSNCAASCLCVDYLTKRLKTDFNPPYCICSIINYENRKSRN